MYSHLGAFLLYVKTAIACCQESNSNNGPKFISKKMAQRNNATTLSKQWAPIMKCNHLLIPTQSMWSEYSLSYAEKYGTKNNVCKYIKIQYDSLTMHQMQNANKAVDVPLSNNFYPNFLSEFSGTGCQIGSGLSYHFPMCSPYFT